MRAVLLLVFLLGAACSGNSGGKAVPTAPEIDWPDAGAVFETIDASPAD